MKKEDLNLRIIEFGDSDEDHTVHGAVYQPIDLVAVEKAGREISDNVILMRCMNVVLITRNEGIIHIHGNGEVVMNGVKSIEEAEEILLRLFGGG